MPDACVVSNLLYFISYLFSIFFRILYYAYCILSLQLQISNIFTIFVILCVDICFYLFAIIVFASLLLLITSLFCRFFGRGGGQPDSYSPQRHAATAAAVWLQLSVVLSTTPTQTHVGDYCQPSAAVVPCGAPVAADYCCPTICPTSACNTTFILHSHFACVCGMHEAASRFVSCHGKKTKKIIPIPT